MFDYVSKLLGTGDGIFFDRGVLGTNRRLFLNSLRGHHLNFNTSINFVVGEPLAEWDGGTIGASIGSQYGILHESCTITTDSLKHIASIINSSIHVEVSNPFLLSAGVFPSILFPGRELGSITDTSQLLSASFFYRSHFPKRKKDERSNITYIEHSS